LSSSSERRNYLKASAARGTNLRAGRPKSSTEAHGWPRAPEISANHALKRPATRQQRPLFLYFSFYLFLFGSPSALSAGERAGQPK